MTSHASIVLAEDHPDIRSLMTDALEDQGYTVIACETGAEAIAEAWRHVPRLVIVDLQMEHPDSGLRVLQSLRDDARTSDVPAILYSANSPALKQHAHELEQHNAVMLGKPFDMGILLTTVADMLSETPPTPSA